MQTEFKTVKDLEALFHVTGRTIQTWRDKGMISYLKIGNKILFTPDHIDEFTTNNFKKQFSYPNKAA